MIACKSDPALIGLKKRVHIPSDWGSWLGDEFRGTVSFARRFGRPTQLADHQKVWLVVEQVDEIGAVKLNENPVGEILFGQEPLRREIKDQLLPRNLLTIEISVLGDQRSPSRVHVAGGLIGSVRLEIFDFDS